MESSTIQNQAAIIREFASHPGMKLLVDKLNASLGSDKMSWIAAKTAKEAEDIRQNSKALAILMGTLNGFLTRARQDESKREGNTEQA